MVLLLKLFMGIIYHRKIICLRGYLFREMISNPLVLRVAPFKSGNICAPVEVVYAIYLSISFRPILVGKTLLVRCELGDKLCSLWWINNGGCDMEERCLVQFMCNLILQCPHW